jgi:hypothetical protein
VLDSVLVSAAERQTVVLDLNSGLTLDDLLQWLRVFFTEDGPNTIRDTGRDGLVSSFTPTAVALLLTLREKLVRTLVPCAGAGCAGGCTCGSRGLITCIPLGCCTKLPPGMYAGRVKIAVSALCGLVERLTAKAIRIGRFAGAVLLDLSVVPFDDDAGAGGDFVRAEVRGLHLRPTYVPAFVADGGNPANFGSLVLPLQGSASADADHLSGVFQRDALPGALQILLGAAGVRGVLMAASEVPLAIIDGELGRVVQGPAVTTWPRLQPAGVVAGDGGPDDWDDIPPNQRFVPQTPLDPVDPEVADECLEDCADDCAGCDCGCHLLKRARSGVTRMQRVTRDPDVVEAAREVRNRFEETDPARPVPARLWDVAQTDAVRDLLDALLAADSRPVEDEDVAEEDVAEEDVAEEDVAEEDVAEDIEEDVADQDRPVVIDRSPTEAEALRRLREIVDERDSSVPLEDRVQRIQQRRAVRDFLVAALEQQPPTPAPTDTEAEATADTEAEAEADKDGREY